MTTMRISDVSGEIIVSGGGSIRIEFAPRSRHTLQADLTDAELDTILNLLVDMGADLDRLEALGKQSNGFATRMIDVKRTSPKAWERWTEDEEAALLAMYREGRPIVDIAQSLGRRPNAIRTRLIKLGVIDELASSRENGADR